MGRDSRWPAPIRHAGGTRSRSRPRGVPGAHRGRSRWRQVGEGCHAGGHQRLPRPAQLGCLGGPFDRPRNRESRGDGPPARHREGRTQSSTHVRHGGRQQPIGVCVRRIGILAGGPLIPQRQMERRSTRQLASPQAKTPGDFFVTTPVESPDSDAANAYDTPLGITNPPIDELLDRASSKYALVIYAAKRARQINDYYNQLGDGILEYVGPLVEPGLQEKPLSIALREIHEDLLEHTEGE